MQPRTFLGRTFFEWAIIATMLLVVARFYWARELRAAEDNLLASIGVDPALKFVVTVPLAAYVYWRLFKREQAKANEASQPVIGKGVLALCAGLLAIVAALILVR